MDAHERHKLRELKKLQHLPCNMAMHLDCACAFSSKPHKVSLFIGRTADGGLMLKGFRTTCKKETRASSKAAVTLNAETLTCYSIVDEVVARMTGKGDTNRFRNTALRSLLEPIGNTFGLAAAIAAHKVAHRKTTAQPGPAREIDPKIRRLQRILRYVKKDGMRYEIRGSGTPYEATLNARNSKGNYTRVAFRKSGIWELSDLGDDVRELGFAPNNKCLCTVCGKDREYKSPKSHGNGTRHQAAVKRDIMRVTAALTHPGKLLAERMSTGTQQAPTGEACTT